MMLLHDKFIEVALNNPEKVFIHDANMQKSFTYKRALIVSIILKEHIKKIKDNLVGIMLPNSFASAISVISTLMSDKIPVMINYSTGAKENIEYAREVCNFKYVITSKKFTEKIELPYVPNLIYIEDLISKTNIFTKFKSMIKSKVIRPDRNSDDKKLEKYCVILFTSGSEKEPKVVGLTHKNIVSNIEGFSKIFDFSEDDVFLSTLPYFHVFGFTTNLFTPIFHSMKIITYPNPLEFRKICQLVKEHKVTILTGTPSFFWGYLRKSEKGDFDTLKFAVVGADKCPKSLIELYKEKHNVMIYEGYGATETSPVISANSPKGYKIGSVGKPLDNLKVKIIDINTDEELGPGKTGKIMVKGPSVMNGYINDLEETSNKLHHGWYDTGDMGYIDEDGYLFIEGRLKRFAKIGGEMISLVRIEETIKNLIPEDVECCVVDIPHIMKGTEIVAVLTREINTKSIMEKLKKLLPQIAIPKRFLFIDEIPKTASGKIDFKKVTHIARQIIENE